MATSATSPSVRVAAERLEEPRLGRVRVAGDPPQLAGDEQHVVVAPAARATAISRSASPMSSQASASRAASTARQRVGSAPTSSSHPASRRASPRRRSTVSIASDRRRATSRNDAGRRPARTTSPNRGWAVRATSAPSPSTSVVTRPARSSSAERGVVEQAVASRTGSPMATYSITRRASTESVSRRACTRSRSCPVSPPGVPARWARTSSPRNSGLPPERVLIASTTGSVGGTCSVVATSSRTIGDGQHVELDAIGAGVLEELGDGEGQRLAGSDRGDERRRVATHSSCSSAVEAASRWWASSTARSERRPCVWRRNRSTAARSRACWSFTSAGGSIVATAPNGMVAAAWLATIGTIHQLGVSSSRTCRSTCDLPTPSGPLMTTACPRPSASVTARISSSRPTVSAIGGHGSQPGALLSTDGRPVE